MATETTGTQGQSGNSRGNGKQAATGAKPRIVRNPGDVAGIVMMQIDNVNAKKDELTIAVKSLADTAKQLVRAYVEHAKTIQRLQERVRSLEEKAKQN